MKLTLTLGNAPSRLAAPATEDDGISAESAVGS
jgi:hypothetical protein